MESELELNPEMSSPRSLVPRALRMHPWQQWPGGDLPDELPASSPAEQMMATTP